MKTVKQVSQLTGVSVRTLQYYDGIGLLKPSEVTAAGYRLYDDDALENLQQILLFRELDFPLKDIGAIMQNSRYDRNQAFVRQKKLLEAKRGRLNGLLDLLNKLIKGEKIMSFKEFDLSGYYGLLKNFRDNHEGDVVSIWGSMENFDQMVDKIKQNEEKTAEAAIQYYGSIEKYTEAMKEHLNELPKKTQSRDKSSDENYKKKVSELMEKLTSDLSKDVSSDEIQSMIGEWVNLVNDQTSRLDDTSWHLLTQGYLSDSAFIETHDKLYGKGSSRFIGNALQTYWKKGNTGFTLE